MASIEDFQRELRTEQNFVDVSARSVHLRKIDQEPLRAVLQRLGVVSGVHLLELDAAQIEDSLAEHFPDVNTLRVYVAARKNPRLHLPFRSIETLELWFYKKPPSQPVEFSGVLPSLQHLRFSSRTAPFSLHLASLETLVATAERPLRSVTVLMPRCWELLSELCKKLPLRPPVELKGHPLEWEERVQGAHGSVTALEEQEQAKEWECLLRLKTDGFEIAPASQWWLCTSFERFSAVKEELREVTKELLLEGSLHAFLFRDPSCLHSFPFLERLRLTNTDGLSSEGLLHWCASLPKLTHLFLMNCSDPLFSSLSIASSSLRVLELLHCHSLKSFELDGPSLKTLVLHDCDNEVQSRLCERSEGGSTGNWGERFLAELLDGSDRVRLPALAHLRIGYTASFSGQPMVYEALRVTVRCTKGHPTLETLELDCCNHLRSITMRDVPSLRFLAIWTDGGEGGSWLEECVLDALDPACKELLPTLSFRGGAALPEGIDKSALL